MIAAKAIEILQRALLERETLTDRISEFQQVVLNDDSAEGPVEEVLRDLAYDLEYYEPDPRKRDEDESFFGPEQAVEEISAAVEKIQRMA